MSFPKTQFVIPDYLPGKTHPFSSSKHEFHAPDKLRKEGKDDAYKRGVFLRDLRELSRGFGEWVPYRFETPTGKRSIDKGMLGFSINRRPPDLELDVVEGLIRRVRLTASALQDLDRLAAVHTARDAAKSFDQVLSHSNGDQPSVESDVAHGDLTLQDISPEISLEEMDYLETDERSRQIAEHIVREGQIQFKKQLLAAYGNKCAVTRVSVKCTIDAAHIRRYLGQKSNELWNGIPLRSDVHRLFDAGLLCFEYREEQLVVLVSPRLTKTGYYKLDQKVTLLPNDQRLRPNALVIDRDKSEKLSGGQFQKK